jgi:hypothetical protein
MEKLCTSFLGFCQSKESVFNAETFIQRVFLTQYSVSSKKRYKEQTNVLRIYSFRSNLLWTNWFILNRDLWSKLSLCGSDARMFSGRRTMVSQDSLTLGENVFATKYASKTSADMSNDSSVSLFVITSVASPPYVHNYPSFVECRTPFSSNMKEDYFSPSMTWTHSIRNYTYQGSLLLLFLFISFRVK